MAKVAVAILKLHYNGRDAYPNEIHEIFMEENAWKSNEDFTFTGRVSIGVGETPRKERIKERIKYLFKGHYGAKAWEEPYTTLIKLLDDNNWDVSFFVDCF